MICASVVNGSVYLKPMKLKDPIVCPYCKARQITVTFYSDYDLPKIIRKNMMEKNYLQMKNTNFKDLGKSHH